jgi:hypothetical protein
MNVLFLMRNTVYVRNFESTLRLLDKRGHRVHIVADEHDFLDSSDHIARLCDECPGISYGPAPERVPNGWSLLGRHLRRGIDYLRYLGPEYRDATKLRERARRTAPPFVQFALRWPMVDSRVGRSLMSRVLRWCDRALPRDPAVDVFVRQHNPDLVLVTPLVEPGCPQAEYLRSARALGIRTGLCVYSWDNLTNKGLIQDPLDVVTVWNQPMKEEAVRLHGVPAERVVVTGAAAYDHWFTWRPRATREAFCAQVRLRADQPYFLYLCSSKFVAPAEVSFVRQWVQQLRTSSSTLHEVGVLVRPHPQNADQWRAADLSDVGQTMVWPPAGSNPIDAESREGYYDSIYHSVAVVGVNTSALIESAILGRPVYTLLAPEFRDTQEGTLHFHHLRHVNGGLLHVARSYEEHLMQLEAAVREPRTTDEQSRRFVEAFVRPYGIDMPATPKVVDTLEAVGAGPMPRPEDAPFGASVVRPLLAALAGRVERLHREGKEQALRRQQKKQAAKTWADREHHEQALRRQQEKQQKEFARAAKVARQQLSVEPSTAYANYLFVRERVRHMQEVEAAAISRKTALSAAEQQMLSALGHMQDATLETIATLRRHCEPITGVGPSDYETGTLGADLFVNDLRQLLKEGGARLLVSEPPWLGGFGYEWRGALYNEDTVKFYEVLAALQLGAVLGAFRETQQRGVVWEVGGGWGGLAFQFKTLCPNVTYVITALPELFLFSAVYLMTVFPNARCRFYGDTPGDGLWRDLDSVDFVFVPEGALDAVQPERLDLTLELMALERMTDERARAHVRRAFDLGSRYLYALCPRQNHATNGLIAVRPILEEFFWPHQIPFPQVHDGEALSGLRLRRQEGSPSSSYCHLMGWKRMLV